MKIDDLIAVDMPNGYTYIGNVKEFSKEGE